MTNLFVRDGKLYTRRDGRGRFITPQRVYTGDDSAEDALSKHEAWVAAGRPAAPRIVVPTPYLARPDLSWSEWLDPFK